MYLFGGKNGKEGNCLN